jgi:hypothetical protein
MSGYIPNNDREVSDLDKRVKILEQTTDPLVLRKQLTKLTRLLCEYDRLFDTIIKGKEPTLKSFTKTTVSDWMRRNQSEELADWLSNHKKFDVQREELAKQNLKDLAKDLGYNIKTIELE